MSEPTPRATDTLIKQTATVLVGEQTYTIATFKFAKTMKALALVAELAEAAGLGEAAKRLMGDGPPPSDGETVEGDYLSIGGLVTQLITVLPKLLRDGSPVAYRYLGLIVTSNADLRAIEENESSDLDRELLSKGRGLAYEGETAEIATLISKALPLMGIETVVQSIAPLLTALRK